MGNGFVKHHFFFPSYINEFSHLRADFFALVVRSESLDYSVCHVLPFLAVASSSLSSSPLGRHGRRRWLGNVQTQQAIFGCNHLGPADNL